MANEQAKQKLIGLAAKIQGRSTTYSENHKLETTLDAKRPATKDTVKQVLAESLGKSANDVNRMLASADDDRIIEEIIKALGK